jgi:hypothetical protein
MDNSALVQGAVAQTVLACVTAIVLAYLLAYGAADCPPLSS